MSQDPVANLEKLIDDIIEQGKQMFPEQKHGLDELFNNLHQLRIMPLATLPNKKLIEFINIMRSIDNEVIKARMKLSIPSPSTTQRMQILRRNNVAVLDKFNDILSECSNYLLWRKADIGLAIQEMVSEVDRVGESTLEQFSKYREEADAIINYLRGAKADNAAQLFADDFLDFDTDPTFSRFGLRLNR